MKKKTHDEYVFEMSIVNPDIEVIGEYCGALIPIKHYNKKCKHTFETSPSSMLSGTKCTVCNKNMGITEEEYVNKLKDKNKNIILIGRYINARTKTKYKCLVCENEWDAFPDNVLNKNTGCPKCATKSGHEKLKNTQDEYIKKLAEKNKKLILIDDYVDYKTKVLHKCIQCGYEYKIAPYNSLAGKSCPVCGVHHSKIGPPPEYRNSIWASKYREFCSQYLSEEEMKTLMPKSEKKVTIICKECKREIEISVSKLVENNICCICGDGWSYPNKFLYGLLDQLGVKFTKEYSPEWANKKRYDIYIDNLNLIIENHGIQHYEHRFLKSTRTLEEEQLNDIEKEKTAKNNGVEHYVVLDCRKSSKDWIKNSIMKSKLPEIIGFNEECVDWTEVDKFAETNYVKVVSKFINDGNSISQIAKILGVHHSTVRRLAKKGREFGLCDYKTKNEIMNEKIDRIKEYIKDHKVSSAKEISNALGITYNCVFEYNKKYNLF